MTWFVNPYTFVPLVADPVRGCPAGHATMSDGQLSGVLDVTWTVRTPLLFGGYEQVGDDGVRRPDIPTRADGTAMIRGSSLLGATRSLHEALVGGCLRVLDTGYVAVHRHPATQQPDMRLAVVVAADGEGHATEVALCDQEIWVDKDLLPRGGTRRPRTGDRLTLPVGRAGDAHGRRLLRSRDMNAASAVAPASGMTGRLDGTWVLLVTDTAARDPAQPAYFVCGRVGRSAQHLAVEPDVWETFKKVVQGADDLRPARLHGRAKPLRPLPAPEFEGVKWPPPQPGRPAGAVIAERLAARPYVHVGQPIWVRVTGGAVTEIRLSLLWRYRGRHTVGERVGNAAPCSDPESLCWSCRLFGSADPGGRTADDVSAQRSYRGHVRADDALAGGAVDPLRLTLAPLASPSPSAGQFYLDHRAVPAPSRLAARNTPAAATWGSCADLAAPRPVRGRKFYWRTADPLAGPYPRGVRREHQTEEMGGEAALVPGGTTFTGRVTFDNLSLADLGSLIAALDPRRVLAADNGEIVTPLGGGKPFGFGAVRVDVQLRQAQTAAERYLGGLPSSSTAEDAIGAFLEAVPAAGRQGWQALAHVLTLGFVDDTLVWYPPGGGGKGSPEFDRSFAYFARTTGLQLRDETRRLVELPPAEGASQQQALWSDP